MGRKAAPSGTDGVLTKLKAVYEFMTRHNLDSLEICESDLQVRMVRRKPAAMVSVPVPVGMPMPQPAAAAPAAASRTPEQLSEPPRPTPREAFPAGTTTIKSPMMGIFYRAPSPSSPPFVKEGEKVPAGQVLCMIEAMKVFNEVKSDFPCTIVRFMLENGKPVKSGQDIFLVQRD